MARRSRALGPRPQALIERPFLAPARWFARLSVRRFATRHGRLTCALAIVVGALVVVNLVREFGSARTGLILGPLVAVALIWLARRWGLSWHDLGLSRYTWLKGAAIALAAIGVIAIGYAIAAALPATRAAFLDARYDLPTRDALITALVVIPLGTVFVEEVAFRGVLQGLLTQHRGVGWGLGVSSVLFGFWHVLPSLGLVEVNPAIRAIAGDSPTAQALVVAGVVAFTTIAGLLLAELRRRSGSLLASGGLHWAVNALGVLAAVVIRSIGAD